MTADELRAVLDAICVAGAEWEAMHVPAAVTDGDWLVQRAEEIATKALAHGDDEAEA